MKKIIASIIACTVMLQASPTFAATSGLSESILEFEAITSALGTNPAFQGVIPQNEFITKIKRLTKKVDTLGTVKYGIVTKVISNGMGGHSHEKHHGVYLATLNIAPNPAIGPDVITVVSIVPITSSHE
jgi:hypothetical protein